MKKEVMLVVGVGVGFMVVVVGMEEEMEERMVEELVKMVVELELEGGMVAGQGKHGAVFWVLPFVLCWWEEGEGKMNEREEENGECIYKRKS